MGRVKETATNSPSYVKARESFVERLRTIAALATKYANGMERNPTLEPDHLDYQVRQLVTETANLAYIQGAASALKGAGK